MTKKKTQQELLAEANKNKQLGKKADKDFGTALQESINYKAQLRQAKALKKEAHFQDLNAQAEEEWKIVLKKADDLLHSGQQGFDSWVSAMSSVVQTSEQRNKAIFSHNSIAHFLYRQMPEFVGTHIILGQDTLPGIEYFVDFDDEGTLNIKNLMVASHGLNPRAALRGLVRGAAIDVLSPDQILTFQAMVAAFLKEEGGCVPDEANPGKFLDKDTKKTQTKETLNNLLKGGPGPSFEGYLQSKVSGANIHELKSPRP